ncbi:hypothetical protein NDU88_002994 [Pleurodeles waltl]|uniref:Uncharacterized protein n=1 Tax=Pleurodeles waltl TaxID=8319 RepID=A0AAV7M7K3_PLEWA|nr:hypothetical protein NDU88_002994 [Pleurodeles waltl]
MKKRRSPLVRGGGASITSAKKCYRKPRNAGNHFISGDSMSQEPTGAMGEEPASQALQSTTGSPAMREITLSLGTLCPRSPPVRGGRSQHRERYKALQEAPQCGTSPGRAQAKGVPILAHQ